MIFFLLVLGSISYHSASLFPLHLSLNLNLSGSGLSDSPRSDLARPDRSPAFL